VADHHSHHLHSHHLPLALDPKDPEFPRQCLTWAFEAKCEIMELIAKANGDIAISRVLMAEADRILGRKWD
jgi:hypothetical protein